MRATSTRNRLSLAELRAMKCPSDGDVKLLQAVQDAVWHVGQAHDRVAAMINARQADALELKELRELITGLCLRMREVNNPRLGE